MGDYWDERWETLEPEEMEEFQLLRLKESEFLKQTGIIKNGHPTIAGILLVGKKEIIQEAIPSHEVVYLHMKNDVEYDLRKDYKEGIISILEGLEKIIESFNKIITVKSGLFHYEIQDFPKEVYREAILNALLHRGYTRGEGVFIKHYSDHMEISNPGGFIGGITPENVRDILKKFKPYGIDVASGVEIAPGVKDIEKIKKLIKEVSSLNPSCF